MQMRAGWCFADACEMDRRKWRAPDTLAYLATGARQLTVKRGAEFRMRGHECPHLLLQGCVASAFELSCFHDRNQLSSNERECQVPVGGVLPEAAAERKYALLQPIGILTDVRQFRRQFLNGVPIPL